MQIVSNGDNLHDMSKPLFLEKLEKYSKCLLNVLPSELSVDLDAYFNKKSSWYKLYLYVHYQVSRLPSLIVS